MGSNNSSQKEKGVDQKNKNDPQQPHSVPPKEGGKVSLPQKILEEEYQNQQQIRSIDPVERESFLSI